MRFRGQRPLLFEYCTPASLDFLVHKQQLCEPARHRRAAVLVVTQAHLHLFLSVILLTSTAFMSRKRKRENYCMLRSEGKIIACSDRKVKLLHAPTKRRPTWGIEPEPTQVYTRDWTPYLHEGRHEPPSAFCTQFLCTIYTLAQLLYTQPLHDIAGTRIIPAVDA
jgi:hypothetical protein